MYRVRVFYPEPNDRNTFDKYYAATHFELVKKIPNLRRFTAGKCDPVGGQEPKYYQIADLEFDSKEIAEAALGSEAGQAATGDVPNFAPPGVTFHFTPDTLSFEL